MGGKRNIWWTHFSVHEHH